jgi:hypothetical protein
MNQHNSAIESLLAQIDKETEDARRGLYGTAIRVPHHIIGARQATIAGKHLDKLIAFLKQQKTATEQHHIFVDHF